MIFVKMNSCRKHPKRYRKKGLRNDGRPQRKLGNIGNRSKLSQIDADKLIADIAGGVAVTIACAAQGIHRDTFYSWLDEQPEFAVKLATAKRDVILKTMEEIRRGSKDQEFRGYCWFLEHCYPEFYAPADKGFTFNQNNLMLGDLDEARQILDAAKGLPYRSENGARKLE
jgi:hypothetical protein